MSRWKRALPLLPAALAAGLLVVPSGARATSGSSPEGVTDAGPTEGAPVLDDGAFDADAGIGAGAILAAPEPAPPAVDPGACRFRDPENGRCFPTADAADEAWLGRPAAREATVGPAPARTGAPARVVLEADLPIEEDPDDPDSEDGGALAPIDPTFPAGKAALKPSPAQMAFWKNLARSVRGLLVVRKVDSRPPVSLPEEELATLFASHFPVPVVGFPPEKLKDSFLASRGRHRRHHAIDLGAPKGTPIIAVADGTIERVGRDRRGGKVVYLRDATGKLLFYYAHLSRFAPGLAAGVEVKKGDVIGEVGSTGRVFGGPHLHFAIFCDVDGGTTPAKGLAINPYLVFTTFLPR
ncbi:MAG: M23 family metallopeptidase [Acidobacteria bacterium]|nr:MAG: M23 family metallopeptidase [Acidobacteriota bacterium]